jgi:autonomous glycyl radical cofactor GrcA
MNKKFIRLMSVILSVMVLFSCAVSASAEEGTEPAPAEKIDVTVRVEGVDKNLADKEIIVDKNSTVKAVIDAASLDVLYAEDGVTIKSVKGGFEYSELPVVVRYFIKKTDGKIFEIDAEKDEKIKEAMAKARETARTVAGKKGGGTTPVYSPRVQNILNIW